MATKTATTSEEFEALARAFAIELITNGGNGSLALRTVAPQFAGNAKSRANRVSYLRKHPICKDLVAAAAARADAALAAALERYDVSADRAASELARLAYTELRQVADWGSKIVDAKTGKREYWLHVRDAVMIDADAHKALVSIERRPDGSLKIALADKLAAQMNLARLKGYVQDKPNDATQAVQLIIQR